MSDKWTSTFGQRKGRAVNVKGEAQPDCQPVTVGGGASPQCDDDLLPPTPARKLPTVATTTTPTRMTHVGTGMVIVSRVRSVHEREGALTAGFVIQLYIQTSNSTQHRPRTCTSKTI